jgi:tetratricopeptide (TPR) repeat protein
LLAGLLFFLVDPSKAYLNRINFWNVETDLERFSNDEAVFDRTPLQIGLRYYKELLVMMPSSAPAWGNLGFCYYYLENFPKAMEVYQKALEQEPLYTLYLDVGMMFFQSQEFPKAVDFFQLSLKNLPQTVAHYVQLQQKLIAGGKMESAALTFSLIQEAREDEERIYQFLARSYFHLEEYARAIVWLNRAIERNPQDAENYYDRALCWQKMHRLESFQADMERTTVLRHENSFINKRKYKLHFHSELLKLRYVARSLL